MSHDRYRRQMSKGSAMVQHLGRALRGRAFFVFRDRRDPSQPQIIACHPPLSDDALLRALGSDHVVCEQVSEDASHHAFVGIASESAFDNQDLAHEMTAVAAQSLATEIFARTPSSVESFDAGTGLPDRDAFVAMLAERHGVARESYANTSLLVVDLDHFHRVIARFGDAGGEELMRSVGERLVTTLDTRVIVARLGGDRFGVLFPHEAGKSPETSGLSVATAVHDALRAPIRVADEDIFVTASIGVSLATRERRPSGLLHQADRAIALAKE